MIYTVIATTVSLVALYSIVFWLYRDYQIDRFRQTMFRVRDDLFDLGAAGEVAFDHPAYCALRSLLNGYIRFGHRVSILPAIIFTYRLTDDEKRWLDEQDYDGWWLSLTNDLPLPTARKLDHLRANAGHVVQQHLILGSPLLVSTVIPAVILIIAVWLPFEFGRTGWQRMTESVEMAARTLGQAT